MGLPQTRLAVSFAGLSTEVEPLYVSHPSCRHPAGREAGGREAGGRRADEPDQILSPVSRMPRESMIRRPGYPQPKPFSCLPIVPRTHTIKARSYFRAIISLAKKLLKFEPYSDQCLHCTIHSATNPLWLYSTAR